jgi:hypothetical protein
VTIPRTCLEENLDLLLSFAQLSPSVPLYEAHARLKGLDVESIEVAPECRVLRAEGFGLMLVDGHLARLHGVGLFDEPDLDGTGIPLGVAVATSLDELVAFYARLREQLCARLGAPALEGSWDGEIGFDPIVTVELAYSAWRFESSILVLLFDDEGDGQIGEWATVDVRIAPRSYEEGLPATIREVFGLPVKG